MLSYNPSVMSIRRLGRAAPVMALLCLLASCASPQQQVANKEGLLSAAGFTVRPANTPQRLAALRSLPANKFVQKAQGSTVRYVYADPLVCSCLYIGNQAAYGRYQQDILQRRLANEQQMTAEMNQDNWDWGPWGPWGPDF